MSSFKKGQLVAVKIPGATKWELRVFERVALTDEPFCGEVIVRRPENATGYCVCMESVCPAEEIWPGLFLEGHRRDELVYRQTLDKAHDQIKWLCGQLNRLSQDSGNCLLPAGVGIPSDDSCRVGGCNACWLIAAKKATGEDADDLE